LSEKRNFGDIPQKRLTYLEAEILRGT